VPLSLVIVAGAGLSQNLSNGGNFARPVMWTSLLNDILRDFDGSIPQNVREKVEANLHANPHLASQYLVDALIHGNKYECLRAYLAQWSTHVKLSCDHSGEMAKVLSKFHGPLLTLNYDMRIEDAVRSNGKLRYTAHVYEFVETEGIPRNVHEKVFHLHGYDDPTLFILRQDEYFKHTYTSQAMQHLTDAGYTIVYLGMRSAFEDPDFQFYLKYEKNVSESRAVIYGDSRPLHCVIGKSQDKDNLSWLSHYVLLTYKSHPNNESHNPGLQNALDSILEVDFSKGSDPIGVEGFSR